MDVIDSDEFLYSDDDESAVLSPNNLEHFPNEILLRIFAGIDDIGLLNLAIINCRFESIAKITFTKRYIGRYFTIDSEAALHRNIYAQQLNRFGHGLRAIKAIGIHGIDNTHWMAQMIDTHLGGHLEKLYFHHCTFKNGCVILASHVNITHLTIVDGYSDQWDSWIHLPQYRHLKKLELRKFHRFTDVSLDFIIRNNSQLESLILHHRSVDFSFPKIMNYVHKYLKNLTEFIVLNDHYVARGIPIDAQEIESFLSVARGLESLGLTMQTQYMDFYERLCRNCKQNVKFLELQYIFKHFSFTEMNQMMNVARSFQNVEILSLDMNYSYHDTTPILSLVQSLPHLRKLYVPQMDNNVMEFMLALLRKCEHLQKLVISISDEFSHGPAFTHHINAHFHREFLNAKRKANVEIVLTEDGRIIGHVTEKAIVWRNKMVHWTGYDPIYSVRKLNFFDLVDQNTENNAISNKFEPRNPFELILSYLDLNSLYALQACSSRGKRLIDNFIQTRSKHGKKFVITDEFNINYNGLRYFAPYVQNLEVELIGSSTSHDIRDVIGMHYKNLRQLTVSTHRPIQPDEFLFHCVEHFIFVSNDRRTIYHLNIIDFLAEYKQLKIVELKCAVKFDVLRDGNTVRDSFSNLQIIKFKPFGQDEVKYATELFKQSGTEIVVLD